jgi:hypothetical protein
MMSRGTPAYPPDKDQHIITKAGARQNAYTSADLANCYTTFAKQDPETVLNVEAGRFQHLDYSEAAFKTGSRAVPGEYPRTARRFAGRDRDPAEAGRHGATSRRCQVRRAGAEDGAAADRFKPLFDAGSRPGWANTAPRAPGCTSASAKCAA